MEIEKSQKQEITSLQVKEAANSRTKETTSSKVKETTNLQAKEGTSTRANEFTNSQTCILTHSRADKHISLPTHKLAANSKGADGTGAILAGGKATRTEAAKVVALMAAMAAALLFVWLRVDEISATGKYFAAALTAAALTAAVLMVKGFKGIKDFNDLAQQR